MKEFEPFAVKLQDSDNIIDEINTMFKVFNKLYGTTLKEGLTKYTECYGEAAEGFIRVFTPCFDYAGIIPENRSVMSDNLKIYTVTLRDEDALLFDTPEEVYNYFEIDVEPTSKSVTITGNVTIEKSDTLTDLILRAKVLKGEMLQKQEELQDIVDKISKIASNLDVKISFN